MGILSIVTETIIDRFLPKGSGFVDKLIQKCKKSNLRNKIYNEIISKYQNELLYNDLSKLLSQSQLSDLIEFCVNRLPTEDRTNEEYVNEMISHVIPCSNYKSQIRSIINNVIDTIISYDWHIEGNDEINANSTTHQKLDSIRAVTSSIQEVARQNNALICKMKETSLYAESDLLTSITAADIKALRSGEYTLAISPSKSTIKVDIAIKYDPTIEKYKSFTGIFDEMVFMGVERQFDVAYANFVLEGGTVLTSYKDYTYDGPIIQLPLVYCKDSVEFNKSFSDMRVTIKPFFEKVNFRIEDQYGMSIIPDTVYRVIRSMNDNYVIVKITGKPSNYEIIITLSASGQRENNTFVFDQSKDELNKCSIKFTIKPLLKNKMLSCLESALLIKRIFESETISVVESLSGKQLITTNHKCITTEQGLEDIEWRIDFLEKVCYLEKKFDVCLDSVDDCDFLIEETTCLYNLMRNGMTHISNIVITLSKDSIKDIDTNAILGAKLSFTLKEDIDWMGIVIPNTKEQYVIMGTVLNMSIEEEQVKITLSQCCISQSTELQKRIEQLSNCKNEGGRHAFE